MAVYTYIGNKRKDDFTSRLLLDDGTELLLGESTDISQNDLDQLSVNHIFAAGVVAVDLASFPFQRAGHGTGTFPADSPFVTRQTLDQLLLPVVLASQVDAKGDLLAGSAADTLARLAVGTNGQALVADSTTATGLKWANAPAPAAPLTLTSLVAGEAPLKLVGDPADAGGNLNLQNRTTTKSASGGTAWYRPGIHHWIDDGTTSRLRWQSPQLDVTDSIGTGTGSRNGGSNAMFGDLVLAYRRDPVDTAFSQDFIYLVDERDGRIGFHRNIPVASYHFGARKSGIDAFTIDDAVGQDNWFLRFTRTDSLKGGFYNNQTAGLSGALVLGGSTAPTEMLDVRGNALVQGLKLTTNVVTAFNSSTSVPFLYGSNSGGSYPFDTAGNLVLQPRVQSGSTTKDILLVTGDPPVPVLTISAASKNVAINQDTTASTGLFGGGAGVIGIRNGTAPSSNPINGGVVWVAATRLSFRSASGDTTYLGGVRAGNEPGVAFGQAGGKDTHMFRVAAGVLGISGGALTAPTMTGHALMLENVSAAPSTNPVGGGILYCEGGALKYRGTGGTITTLGAA